MAPAKVSMERGEGRCGVTGCSRTEHPGVPSGESPLSGPARRPSRPLPPRGPDSPPPQPGCRRFPGPFPGPGAAASSRGAAGRGHKGLLVPPGCYYLFFSGRRSRGGGGKSQRRRYPPPAPPALQHMGSKSFLPPPALSSPPAPLVPRPGSPAARWLCRHLGCCPRPPAPRCASPRWPTRSRTLPEPLPLL